MGEQTSALRKTRQASARPKAETRVEAPVSKAKAKTSTGRAGAGAKAGPKAAPKAALKEVVDEAAKARPKVAPKAAPKSASKADPKAALKAIRARSAAKPTGVEPEDLKPEATSSAPEETPAPLASPRQPVRLWTSRVRTAFLEALADLGQVRAAARAAGVSPQRVYRERQKCPEFAKAWKEAMDLALDALEETLLDRAMNGVEKQVYYGGKSCGSVRQYSDALAMFLLRARRPETYGRAATGEAQAAPSATGEKPGDRSEGRDDPIALIEARLRMLAACGAGGPGTQDG